jgi:uncharacterized Zn-finger protein
MRTFTTTCSYCGMKFQQDWEEPDECPYCDNGESED